MAEGLSMLAVALFMAVVNERLVEWFVAPLFKKYKVDTLWMRYIAGVTGFVISFFAGMNLFGGFIGNAQLGTILTGIVVGGGSNLVHELFSSAVRKPDPLEALDYEASL